MQRRAVGWWSSGNPQSSAGNRQGMRRQGPWGRLPPTQRPSVLLRSPSPNKIESGCGGLEGALLCLPALGTRSFHLRMAPSWEACGDLIILLYSSPALFSAHVKVTANARMKNRLLLEMPGSLQWWSSSLYFHSGKSLSEDICSINVQLSNCLYLFFQRRFSQAPVPRITALLWV